MTYLLYAHDSDARELSRFQAQRLLSKSTLRSYASSCSCAHCRTYVLQSSKGEIVNLRVANKGCSSL